MTHAAPNQIAAPAAAARSTSGSGLKVHIALNVSDVERSVAFYRAFFGAEPVKRYPGYAKFDVAEPALNLALNERPVEGPGALNHLGIEVASSALVSRAIERLRAAGLATLEEQEVDCCHALQDKVWASDPDGYRWEVFTLLDPDTGASSAAGVCCA